MSLPQISPGTVSKILWHFTGGPTWDPLREKQNSHPKPAAAAYKNLKDILATRTLRLGSYREVVAVTLPTQRVWDLESKSFKLKKNVRVTLVSSPVCCVSDIPAPHLRYHAYRYGRFAIGFHRDSIVRHGFTPVLYSLHNAPVTRSIYEAFSSFPEGNFISHCAFQIDDIVSGNAIEDEVTSLTSEISHEADEIERAIQDVHRKFEHLLAMVKTFDADEFASIYCEREWRSLKALQFSFSDVAMIVVPRQVGRTNYYKYFVQKHADRLQLPRTIPIVPWEDLVEH